MIPQGCNERCRGCRHREWSEAASLEQKHEYLSRMLAPWKDALQPVASVHGEARWGYRAKVTLSADYANGWQFGMMAHDELIPIPQCPVHAPVVENTIQILTRSLPEKSVFPLAYVVQTAGQVVLVAKCREIPATAWLTENVVAQLKSAGVEGLWVHCNPSAGKRIFEKTPWQLLFGAPRSQDLAGLWYGPGAFQQLIPALYYQSLDEADRFLAPTPNHAVVDLYCGTGASMRRWAVQGAAVLGVELGGEAVACAGLNVPEATVLRGACRQRLPQVNAWWQTKKSEGSELLLYLNPPRTGLEPEVLQWIVEEAKPSRLAYLSCSAGTLGKNLAVLSGHGYEVKKLTPFDFFPQTIHVECLALVERAAGK